ncbi:MAG: hypothetical protein ACFN04_08305 [Propionibacterium acidifaciens]
MSSDQSSPDARPDGWAPSPAPAPASSKAKHTPHDLAHSFDFHRSFLENGTMKLS